MSKFVPRQWKRKAQNHNCARLMEEFARFVEQDILRDLGDQISDSDRGRIAGIVAKNSRGLFAGGVR